VSGDAVDIAHSDGAAWLSEHGAKYRLCQIYGNEPWHYERRPEAVGHGCPAMYADPTHDPRMQQRSARSSASRSRPVDRVPPGPRTIPERLHDQPGASPPLRPSKS
jgi:hypothetical protein